MKKLLGTLLYGLYVIINVFVWVGETTESVFKILFMIGKFLVTFFATFTVETSRRLRKKSMKLFTSVNKKTIPLRKISFRIKLPKLQFLKKVSSSIRSLKRFSLSILSYTGTKILTVLTFPFHLTRKIKTKTPSFTLPFSIRLRYILLGSFITLTIVLVYQSYFFIKALPSPTSIGKVNYPLSTHIYDRKGRLLYVIYKDQNRTPIKLSDLPPYVAEAAIAIEDKDFYNHRGVSFVGGILRAIKEMAQSHELQGGSTITQQLVKSALLTPERTITRKIKEIILAIWTERLYTKAQILEMYLNQVPYGGSSYGIEQASQTYFGKSARSLSLTEAATLAGFPQAPSLYSPYANPQLAIRRRNEVLANMYERGTITYKQETTAQKSALTVVPLRSDIQAPHFVFYIKNELEKQYGADVVEEGGLRVYTTLDLDVQHQAEQILKEELAKIPYLNVSNGDVLITKPKTGEILAMVGSVDYFASPSGAFNVITGLRQPGSSIKPIMYSLALQQGYTAASIIDDSPISFSIPGGPAYAPVNYDGRSHGKVTLRMALANSYNIPAVKVLNSLGVNAFIDYARRLGITTWEDPSRYGLSLTLGGGEVTMTDMATAYGVLANQGYKVPLSGILKIDTIQGEEMYSLNSTKTKVVNEGVAYIISDILSDNIARLSAFGAHSALEIPNHKVAVKTGTTDSKRDNWTMGYTPDYLVGVWVGNNDNTPMNPYLTSGITGAAPIWNRVMAYVLDSNHDTAWYSKPENIVERLCGAGKPEYFLAGTERSAPCRDIKNDNSRVTVQNGSVITPTPFSSPNFQTNDYRFYDGN